MPLFFHVFPKTRPTKWESLLVRNCNKTQGVFGNGRETNHRNGTKFKRKSLLSVRFLLLVVLVFSLIMGVGSDPRNLRNIMTPELVPVAVHMDWSDMKGEEGEGEFFEYNSN